MKTISTFSDEVRLWLCTSGLPPEHLKKANSLFSEFVLPVSDEKEIHIKLIDFNTWAGHTDDTFAELLEYGQQMRSLRAAGHDAIVLWEDVWRSRPAIVKSRILSMMGRSERVPGRLTIVKRIDKKTASEFLTTNHLHGAVSSKTQYALYLPRRYFRVLKSTPEGMNEPDLLIAVATFSHARIFSRNGKPFRSFEMIRFCSRINMTVVGGLDKLVKAFAHDFDPGDLMTYADLEWSDGTGYRRLGFEQQKDVAPITFRVNRESMTRHALSADLPVDSAPVMVINQGSRKYVKVFQQSGSLEPGL